MTASAAQPPSPGPPAGRRVVAGRYRLDAVLGRGAMGIVWAGRDQVLNRAVAVKEVIAPKGTPPDEASELRERTMREARANALLAHHNVITVYDVVLEYGEPFVVMELFPSTSLAAVVRHKGPLSIVQAAAAGEAVAAALEVAHRAGITHRDVKPGNVLVSEEGQLKLSDFGIARNVQDSTITGTGLMLGTPAYISPEVASGGPARPEADLWGLGATLFALVEGRPPYDEGDPLDTVTQVVQGAVPRPTRAGPLAPVIAGLMVKNPRQRMPLGLVRRRLQALVPRSAAPFDLSDLPTISHLALTSGYSSASRTRTDLRRPPLDAGLAVEPGPLPFTPSAPRRRSRRWPRILVIVLAAAFLFVLAGAAGFVAARGAAGRSLLPAHPPAEVAMPLTPREPLVTHDDQVSVGSGADAGGGHFTIGYPVDWTSFHAQHGPDTAGHPSLPPGAELRYVSPNGDQELSVERLENFYPALRIRDFLRRLVSTPQVTLQLHDSADHPGGGQFEDQRDLLYRSEERGLLPGSAQATGDLVLRSRFLRVVPHDNDLWILQLVTDTSQEVPARQEFDEIVQGFEIS